GVSKFFRGLKALDDVSFEIEEGEIVGLIGPNGAGKTTLFNCICGVYRPDIGDIAFFGKDITGLSPHEITRLGIGRTYQIPRPFGGISVLENVMTSALYGRRDQISMKEAREIGISLLEFVDLKDKWRLKAR
ncbi:MAG: ATP-binding cassette domain-containing protein, partial [Thermoproteota archaeon]